MKVSKDYIIQEFVPPQIYNRFGKKSIWFIRPGTIKLAQFIRDWFGVSIYINNYYWEGGLRNRGFRMPDTDVGSQLSQHKFGNAIDFNVAGMKPNQVRKEILDNENEFMQAGLSTLEHEQYAPSWIHADRRETHLDHILIVKP